MRRSRQLHFDPGKMAVMVWSGSATHRSNCTRLRCSKYPHSTRKISLGKLKCIAQSHTTGRLTRSNAFARSNTNETALNSSSPARYLKLSISNKISQTVCFNAVLLVPLRHLRCSQSFPPSCLRRHKRNRPRTGAIFRNQKRTSLSKLAAATFHFVPPFPKTPQFLFLFLSSRPMGFFGWKPSHPSPVFSLYNLEAFSQFALFQPW